MKMWVVHRPMTLIYSQHDAKLWPKRTFWKSNPKEITSQIALKIVYLKWFRTSMFQASSFKFLHSLAEFYEVLCLTFQAQIKRSSLIFLQNPTKIQRKMYTYTIYIRPKGKKKF